VKGLIILKLDKTDRQILEHLIEDGRISYVDLGKHVGLSRVAVRDRVNQLIKNGVIEKFTAIINSEQVGKSVSAFFEVDVEPMQLVTIAKSLADNESVASIYQMTGPSTLHMHVLVNDFIELEHFINEELYSFEGIMRVESHVLLKRFKSRVGLKL